MGKLLIVLVATWATLAFIENIFPSVSSLYVVWRLCMGTAIALGWFKLVGK